ncbi:Hypothetical protein (Fragment) [Durusdinium trenchii]|uniref:Apple domain-containing protein n=1 Tax=Durusdinium trenchii TaxID=1381693 RepID=A0ABP0SAE1_9DINO
MVGREEAPPQAVVVADPEMQERMPTPPPEVRWWTRVSNKKLKVAAVVVVVAVVGVVVGVVSTGGEAESEPAGLGPIGAALCVASEECSSGHCGPNGQCLCQRASDCLGDLDECEIETGICSTPMFSSSDLAHASERAQEGQQIWLQLEDNITCPSTTPEIGIVSNRTVTVRGQHASIGEACQIKVASGSELAMASVQVLGSIEIDEGAHVNLTDVVLDMEICPFGWKLAPGSQLCLFVVSEIGLPMSVTEAQDLCAGFLGSASPRVPALADLASQADRDLAQSLLFDEAAWVGGQCATILPDGSPSSAPCDGDLVRFAVCSVPRRVPVFPPQAASLSNSQLLINSAESYRQILGDALFPGDEPPLDRRVLQQAVDNNTVVLAQRDVAASALPLAMAASDEPWQVELDLDHPCGDLVMQVGSDLNDNLTEVTDEATPSGLIIRADLSALPGEIPRFVHLFANAASCACVHRVALLKGGQSFVDLSMQFAVDSGCDRSFPGIALSGDGCLLLDDAQRPDAVLPSQVALDIEATECDRFSLKQHPAAGSAFEVRVGVQGGIDALTFEDAATSRKLTLSETAPNQFSVFLDETSRRLVTSIRVIGNATIATPKITSVQTLFQGAQVAGWDPTETHTCSQVCPVIHDATGIDFGVVQQMEFHIDSVNTLRDGKTLCDKIDSVITYTQRENPTPAETTSSETTCTAPVQQVAVDEIQEFIDDNKTTWRFLPLVFNVTDAPQTADLVLSLPGDARLQVEIEQLDDTPVIVESIFVPPGAGLELSGVVVKGQEVGSTTSTGGSSNGGQISNSGYMLIDGCVLDDISVVSQPEKDFGFLNRALDVSDSSESVFKIVASDLAKGNLIVAQAGDALVELDSVKIDNAWSIKYRSSDGLRRIKFSRVEVAQGVFVMDDHILAVEFLDLHPEIVAANVLTDPACTSTSQSASPLFEVSSLDQCFSACRADSSCIGLFFDAFGPALADDEEDAAQGPQCGLCRPQDLGGCSFDCASPSSYFFRLHSAVSFVDLGDQFCAVGNGVVYDHASFSLEDCKGWCSSTPGCAMISFNEVEGSCVLFDVAAVAPCTTPVATDETVHVDTKVMDGFTELPSGICLDRSSSTAISTITDGASSGSCASVCAAMNTDCVAFEVEDSGFPSSCSLFGSPALSVCPTTGQSITALVDLSDASFPSVDPASMVELGCNPPGSLATSAHVAPSLGRCKAKCDQDPQCDAFTFTTEFGAENCWTFRGSSLDAMFDATQCLEDPSAATRSFLSVNRIDFVDPSPATVSLSCGSDRFPALALTLDQCKQVCSSLVPGCSRIAFDSASATPCRVTCDPTDGQAVVATHVFEASTPGTESGIEYFGDVAVCVDDLDIIDVASVVSTRSVGACHALCDINSDCVGFTTNVACNLVRNLVLKPSTTLCSSVVNVQVAFQGVRNFEYAAAPERAVFADVGTLVPPGDNSVRVCLQKCSEDVTCQAASLRAGDQACINYVSRKFFEDSAAPVGAQNFVAFTRSFFEQAFGGALVHGATIVRTLNDLPQAACLRACDLMAACQAVRFDSAAETCELRAGDAIAVSGEVTDAIVFFGRVQVYPFTEVTTDFNVVCPDPSAIVSTSAPGEVFDAEACQALCEAERSCGFVLFDAAAKTCKLYDARSFVTTDTPSCRSSSERLFVAYLEFLERDSRRILEIPPRTPGADTLCAGSDVDDVTLSTLIPANLATCQTGCLAARECSAFVLRGNACHLLRANHSISVCDGSTDVLGIPYVGPGFTQVNASQCLVDTVSTLVNRFAATTAVPECAALCEAHATCQAFRVVNGCELFDTAETSTCDSGTEEEAYVKFSAKPFTRLGRSFCVASRLAAITATEEECKAACSSTFGCRAVEFSNELRECILHDSDAFFSCQNSRHDLFISHGHRLTKEPQRSLQSFVRMCFHNFYHTAPDTSCAGGGTCAWGSPCTADAECQDTLECVPTNSSFWSGTGRTALSSVCMGVRNSDKETCISSCLGDPDCRGAQFYTGDGDNVCGHLTQAAIDAMASAEAKLQDCGNRSPGFEIHLKVETSAAEYRKLDGNCLKTPLDDHVGPFLSTTLLDCMSICDAFATCKHFTRSVDGECRLFGYQLGNVNETECDTSIPGITTFVNTASFVDAVQYFGEPEYIMMELPGATHAECSAACDALDECNAFIHDWSKNKVTGLISSIVEPQRMATKLVAGLNTRVWELEHHLETDNFWNWKGDHYDYAVNLVEHIDTHWNRRQRAYVKSVGADQVRVLFYAEDDRFYGDHVCLALSESDIKVRPCSEADSAQVFVQGTTSDGYITLAPLSRPTDCLSWASDTNKVTLAVGDCTSDTSQFEQASLGVRLAADSASSECLTTGQDDPTVWMQRCYTAPDGYPTAVDWQTWTYLFSSQRWTKTPYTYWTYSAPLNPHPRRHTSQDQSCLQIQPDGAISETPNCTETNTTFVLGTDGTVMDAGGQGLCITAQNGRLRAESCEQGAQGQKWSSFAVCKLTTRERSGVFLMENTHVKWRCMRNRVERVHSACLPELELFDTVSMTSCPHADAKLMYKYRGSTPAEDFSLERVDGHGRSLGTCLRRNLDGGVFFGSCGAPEDFPFTNWIHDPTSMTFKGMDGRILSAQVCNRDAFAFPEAESQLHELYTEWRSYEDEQFGQAVELSVTPTPVSFEVTDPELLFQLWLWTDFGVRSRQLLAKVETVSDTLRRVAAFVSRSQGAMRRAVSVLSSVDSTLSIPITILNRLATFLLVVDPIVLFFEKVPYVGPIVKGARLRSVLRQGRKALTKAQNTGGRLGTTALAGTAVVTGVLSRMLDASDSLDELPSKLRSVASMVTRLARCAFEQANVVVQDNLNALMDKIKNSIDTFQLIVGELSALLVPVTDAIDAVISLVVKPVNALRAALRPTEQVLDALDFLVTLFSFKIPISYPVGLYWKGGCFCCDCLRIRWRTLHIGLEEVGKFLEWLDRTIRSIPFIGWVMDIIDSIIRGILGALFPRIRIPLPDFGAFEGFAVLDNVGDKFAQLVTALNAELDEMMSASLAWVEGLDDIIDLAPVDDLIANFPVFDGFPECEDLNCFLSPLGLPSFPDEVLDSMVKFANQTARLQAVMESPEFNQRVANLMEHTGECTEYKEMPVFGLGHLASTLGLNETEVCQELLDKGARTLEYCSGVEVDSGAAAEAEELAAWLSDELGDMVADFGSASTRRRQLLQDNTGTGLTVSLTVAIPFDSVFKCWGPQASWLARQKKSVGTRIFKTDEESVRKAKDLQRRNRRDSTEGDFSVGGPAGVVVALERKEVLGITLAFPLQGGVVFGFGVRAQAQIRFQALTSWSRMFREAAEPVLAVVETEEDVYDQCERFATPEMHQCRDFRTAYDELMEDVIMYNLLFDPDTANGQRKWQELLGLEQTEGLAWFERMKRSSRRASDLANLAGEAREALDRAPEADPETCSRFNFVTRKPVIFQIRLSSQKGGGSVAQPFVPFTGFQVNLGNFMTFRKDFHIIPAIEDAVEHGNGAGLFTFSNRLGNAALMFSYGFLVCALQVWLDFSMTPAQKWTEFKEQCDKRPDFFFGGSLHLGVSFGILQMRIDEGVPLEQRVTFLGAIGGGNADDQVV